MHPIVAEFGPFTIYSYGMMVAIAFIIGIYFARLEALRRNIKSELVYDLVFFLAIGSLIGARLYYLAFFNPASFIKDPISVLKIWEGGLAIHGAILGGILSGILFSRLRKMSFWKIADITAPSLILGQAVGRIGCFLNGCCFGTPTQSIFGIRFPGGSLPDIAYSGLPVHPTQLYEFALDLAGFFMLWSIRRRLKFDGGLFLLYLVIYSAIRIIVSGLRGDSLYIWGSTIKIAQAVSAVIFIIAALIFIKRQKNA
ncbi:MAG: prolipoprotein diacylglyceryl transferase [Candidatus Omnitrophota bacterium]